MANPIDDLDPPTFLDRRAQPQQAVTSGVTAPQESTPEATTPSAEKENELTSTNGTTTPGPISDEKAKNDRRLDDFFNDVRKFGRESGSGQDALPKLGLRTIAAAADGIVTLDKDTNGKDDADRIFDTYSKEEGKKAVINRTNGSLRAQVSKTRQLIKVGQMTTCDPVVGSETLMRIRGELMNEGHKVKSAFPALVDYARRQLDADAPLSDDELRELAAKPAPAGKSVEEELQAILKRLERLITGESKAGQDQHEETIAAQEALQRRVKEFTQQQQVQELQTQAASFGLQLVSR